MSDDGARFSTLNIPKIAHCRYITQNDGPQWLGGLFMDAVGGGSP